MEIKKQTVCPECGANWDGGDIFETLVKQDWWKKNMTEDGLREYVKKFYAPPYRYSRIIGVEDPMVYDGVSWWKCPDCGTMWDRWTNEKVESQS